MRAGLIVLERRTSVKEVAIPLEANFGKVERAIEEAALKCAEESEYIAEPERAEMVEEPVSIRLRRAR